MDRCPPELWTKIASHACTDGGYTGCSLSLVSHAMYQAVDPVRYQSVALIGNEQLVDFAARLAVLRRPPVIRHLFIADLHVERSWHNEDRYLSRIAQRLHNIILCSAPNVITLTIHDWIFNLVIDDVIFPCLRDLMISRSNSPKALGEEDLNLRFPALRRLCMLPPLLRPYDSPTFTPATINTSRTFWTDLTRYTSRITHLTLLDANMDGYFLQFLRMLLRLPVETNHYFNAADIREAHDVVAQLSSLRHMFVQPERPRHYICSQCGRSITASLEAGLLCISDESTREDSVASATLEVLPPLGWHQEYTFREAYTDWCAAVEGADGPWAGPAEALEEPPSSVVRGTLPARMPSPIPSTPNDRGSPPLVVYTSPRIPHSPSGSRSPSPIVPPFRLDHHDTDKLHARVSQLTSAFTSLHHSVAMGNEMHRIERRLASEMSTRDFCLSLQLLVRDPAACADLQRRVDQHNEVIVTLERDLSEAESRLKEAGADVVGSINDPVSVLGHAPAAALPGQEADPGRQGSRRLEDYMMPQGASPRLLGCSMSGEGMTGRAEASFLPDNSCSPLVECLVVQGCRR